MSEIGLEELARRLDEVAILDVRTRAEYDGSAGSPCDPRQGHIPGARHLDVYRLMELPPEEAREAVGLADGAEVVAYCHSGSRSAIATQVLRALGYDARNYVGSWHEWSRHRDLPVES
ncbi:MAG TPA: rhodanese-like domain-containing protein [Gaiellaceae bacterium]|nr:rhodanese-like domain-containing protein [Gaiellaceae bacterium]